MKKKVLIVDDSNTNNFLLQSILDLEGINSTIAFSGEEAFKLLKIEKPSLILLDIMMPDQDGFSILSKLKESPDTKNIPVVFITARSEDGIKEKAIKAGAIDLLNKPIEVNDVLHKVKNILIN